MYVILIHQRYRRTDGQTDDMRSQYRALHYSASRGKNRLMHAGRTEEAGVLARRIRTVITKRSTASTPGRTPKMLGPKFMKLREVEEGMKVMTLMVSRRKYSTTTVPPSQPTVTTRPRRGSYQRPTGAHIRQSQRLKFST